MRFMNFAVPAAALVATMTLTGCFGPSEEEITNIKEQCVKFVEENRNSLGAYIKAVDHWTKDGNVVVEVAQSKHSSDTTYTPRLCVYNQDKGTIQLPALMSQDRWRK